MTPYQYVSNNPIMFTDPTGMIGEEVKGVNSESAQKLHEDINAVFADKNLIVLEVC